MFEGLKLSLKAQVSQNMHQESTDEYTNFQFSVVIMRYLPFKKYQTCELKSKIIDYREYSVKICAFYRASVTTFFFLNFDKIWTS